MERNPYLRGGDDFTENHPNVENPFKPGSYNYFMWQAGYDKAWDDFIEYNCD